MSTGLRSSIKVVLNSISKPPFFLVWLLQFIINSYSAYLSLSTITLLASSSRDTYIRRRGLTIELLAKLAIVLQAQSRLWRIGQAHGVRWIILYAHHTFDGYIEDRN
ncbi:hypothetical protein GGI43DRAFT_408908 [Trichoderma evansii]